MAHLGEYVGSQIAIWTPVMFGLCVVVIWSFWRRGERSAYRLVLLLAATLPLVFFGISSLRGRVEANWPMFAFFPAMMLVAHWLKEDFSRRRVFWAELAVKIALAATIILHIPEAVWAINPAWGTSKWDELFGWRELRGRWIRCGPGGRYLGTITSMLRSCRFIWRDGRRFGPATGGAAQCV